MEIWLLIASIIICVLCFQNIYVQVKRNGFVLIWYSVSNSFLSLSYVVGGITLGNGFAIERATISQQVWCGISGLILTLSSISNAGLALALSIDLYASLRLTNPAARQDPRIIRFNTILAFIMPIISVLASVMILGISGDRIFTNFDDGGVCEISRHGEQRIALFIFRTLPEYLPIYPSCVLSVLALIPVAQKVFENRRLQNSLSIPWAIEKEATISYTLPTRGGPPPNPSIPPNAKMLLPKNVLLRMGLWCFLLIIFGIPTSILLLKTNITCLISGIPRLNYLPDIDIQFWRMNGNSLHMVLTMALFLLCFGTGEFANEQYRELWTIVFYIIFCRWDQLKPSKRRSQFEMVQPPNRVTRITPTSTSYSSYTSQTPPSQSFSNHSHNQTYTTEYQNYPNYQNNPNLQNYQNYPNMINTVNVNFNNNNDERIGSTSESVTIKDVQKPKKAARLPYSRTFSNRY